MRFRSRDGNTRVELQAGHFMTVDLRGEHRHPTTAMPRTLTPTRPDPADSAKAAGLPRELIVSGR